MEGKMGKNRVGLLIILIFVASTSISFSENWIKGYYDDTGKYVYGHYANHQKGNLYDGWRKKLYLSTILAVDRNNSGTPLEYFYNNWSYQKKYELQLKLQKLRYYYGDLDGDIGPIAINAVKNFQKDNKLKVDGKAGPNTSKLIDKLIR
jgi:hypothetical protein